MTKLNQARFEAFMLAVQSNPEVPEHYDARDVIGPFFEKHNDFLETLTLRLLHALMLYGPETAVLSAWHMGFQIGREFAAAESEQAELREMTK
jgi:hypothetical protein